MDFFIEKVIDDVLACSGTHYHDVLRTAAHLARAKIEGCSLGEVESSLETLGLTVLNRRTGGDSEFHEFEVGPNFNAVGINIPHALTLHVHSWGLSAKHSSMTPAKIYRANFAIVFQLESELADLLLTFPFAQNSIGDRFLRSDLLRRENSDWPMLTKGAIFYEYIKNHHRDMNPFAFIGEFDFRSYLVEPVASKHFCMKIESGLDPWCSHSGEWSNFRNPHEFGSVEFNGSGQSGKWPANSG